VYNFVCSSISFAHELLFELVAHVLQKLSNLLYARSFLLCNSNDGGNGIWGEEAREEEAAMAAPFCCLFFFMTTRMMEENSGLGCTWMKIDERTGGTNGRLEMMMTTINDG